MRLKIIGLLSLLLAFIIPTQAFAAPYRLPSGHITNIPSYAQGTLSQQYIYIRAIVAAFNGAPKGSTVTVSTFSWSQEDTVNAAVAAYKRGVHIKGVVFDRMALKNVRTMSLVKLLGQNRSRKSYLVVCKGSCMDSGTTGIQHLKSVTFSQTTVGGKTYKYVTFVGSGNLSGATAGNAWNEHTVIYDKKIHDHMAKWVSIASRDRTYKNYPSVTSGSHKITFFPSTTKYDPIATPLKNVKCKTTSRYGSNNRTTIKIAVFGWSYLRKGIVYELKRLRKQGCKITVIINDDRINHTLDIRILKMLVEAKIPTYNGYIVKSGQVKMYNHSKSMFISGNLYGKNQNVSYTGSMNWTRNAMRINTELILRTNLSSASEMNAWFARMQQWAPRVTRVVPTKPDVRQLPREEEETIDE